MQPDKEQEKYEHLADMVQEDARREAEEHEPTAQTPKSTGIRRGAARSGVVGADDPQSASGDVAEADAKAGVVGPSEQEHRQTALEAGRSAERTGDHGHDES